MIREPVNRLTCSWPDPTVIDVMKSARFISALVLPLLLLAAAVDAAERLTTPEWLALLQEASPGTLILMRHSITRGEPYAGWSETELAARQHQRKLSADGIALCRRMGDLFREAELHFPTVYTSPLVRAFDTARLVFGEHVERWPPLASADAGLDTDSGNAVQERLLKLHAGAPMEIWVTHSPNISELAGIAAAEGDMLAARIEAEGGHYRLRVIARWRLP